ncbi:MAG: hypothetical protein EA342_18885 [Leptolyngbya sp. LCM1.Bin17]|nr:MAG: hypothetical protein EA342_18885 [Leptolyngbya sp. LCM1.Bin17]
MAQGLVNDGSTLARRTVVLELVSGMETSGLASTIITKAFLDLGVVANQPKIRKQNLLIPYPLSFLWFTPLLPLNSFSFPGYRQIIRG